VDGGGAPKELAECLRTAHAWWWRTSSVSEPFLFLTIRCWRTRIAPK
jgi:hypothetical protein